MYTLCLPAAKPGRAARCHWRGAMAAMFAVLTLSACAGPRASARGPEPAEPGPEQLGEGPVTVDDAVRAPKRDILGGVAYDLPLEANSWVETELDFLVGERSAVIGRWLERGAPYEGFIKQVLKASGLPTDLYHLALIESGMIPTARSRVGAVGFWQFMPATARGLGLRMDTLVDERMDPIRSTRAAARHLRGLYRTYNDWALAAAAYNAGSGRVSRSMQRFGARNFWDLAQRGDLAAETRHYVPRLYAVTIIARSPERFGLPAARPGGFGFDSIQVEYATPLEELARLGGATAEQLARLNPHLLRGTTPAGGYWVWVPAGQGVAMQRAWLASEFRQQQGHGTYVVRAGDNLGKLAELSGVRASRIRELNSSVDFDRLQIGAKLKLPQQAAQALNARPVRRDEPATKEPAKAVVASAEPVVREPAAERRKEEPGVTRHTVREGETLWGIAREHNVEVAAIQGANSLSSDGIRPGQELQIPRKAEAGAAKASKASKAAEVVAVEHVVQSGDTLWSIARKYGSSIEAIQSANQLGERPIVPGQKLSVPR